MKNGLITGKKSTHSTSRIENVKTQYESSRPNETVNSIGGGVTTEPNKTSQQKFSNNTHREKEKKHNKVETEIGNKTQKDKIPGIKIGFQQTSKIHLILN